MKRGESPPETLAPVPEIERAAAETSDMGPVDVTEPGVNAEPETAGDVGGPDATDAHELPSFDEIQVDETTSVDRLGVVPARDGGDADEDRAAGVEHARALPKEHLRGLLEALVFASDKPLKSNELARLASAPVKQVKELLAELKASSRDRGVVLDEVAGGWILRTHAQYAPFVRELTSERPVRLTRAQTETLAITAYRQPITRPEIDDIRGVDSGATLKLLLERDLVRILGKKDEPGRPLLYGTTTHFLELFSLKSLKDLPTLKEFTELSEESLRVAEAELGEILPEASAAPQAAPEAPLPRTGTLSPPPASDHEPLAPTPAAAQGDEAHDAGNMPCEGEASAPDEQSPPG